jgi:WD40 repeat protein
MIHQNDVNSAQFSPDGTRVVTASLDKTARVWDAQTGKPISEPMIHQNDVNSAQFSPDGTRVATASWDKTSRVWYVMPGGKVLPEWLPRLADAVACQHLNDRSVFEPIGKDSVEVVKQIKNRVNDDKTNDDWVIWGRWFLADRSTRTISPFSKITVPEYIENRIKENTAESLDEAEQLAVGNKQLLQRIQQARENLKQKSE